MPRVYGYEDTEDTIDAGMPEERFTVGATCAVHAQAVSRVIRIGEKRDTSGCRVGRGTDNWFVT